MQLRMEAFFIERDVFRTKPETSFAKRARASVHT